ncbi:hypothetical protein Hanom_Chr02g00100561 [Helianthus anomalus]
MGFPYMGFSVGSGSASNGDLCLLMKKSQLVMSMVKMKTHNGSFHDCYILLINKQMERSGQYEHLNIEVTSLRGVMTTEDIKKECD